MYRGDRVIVGGAEILHRKPIIQRFVELSGGSSSRLAVLASATVDPAAGFEKMLAWFQEAGIDPVNVELLQVPGHRGSRGAWNPEETAKLDRASGLWILGGDQNRILSALRGPDGGDSPLLESILRRSMESARKGGLVVGGTSAGAAVMSDPMIGSGTSFGALALPRATSPGEAEMSRSLHVIRGLGLFSEGILDQHFDTRSRLGRLLEAALVEDGARRPAFGIAESTALVREGATGRLTVIGHGTVCIIDPRPARRSYVDTAAGPRVRILGAILHCLSEGDSYDTASGSFDFGSKEPISPGDAAFASEFPEASGILSPYNSLADFAARMLLDNDPGLLFRDSSTGRRYVRSLLAEDCPDGSGLSRPLAWEIRLGRDGGPETPSRLYYDGRYSFEQVFVDMIPVDIEINRPN